jgi:hypothetical protein
MINSITPEYMEHIPEDIKEGILYISKEFETAIHLCACGCGRKTVTPFGKGGWVLTESDGLVTLRPSIGNFRGENPYHAHYYITNNKIEWC